MRKISSLAALSLLTLSLQPRQAAEPFIRITYPNGGELLKAGSVVEARWLSLGVGGAVAILLFKDGEQHEIIAPSAPNTGLYRWTIPADIPEGGRYRLRVSALPDLRVNDFSDRDFAIRK